MTQEIREIARSIPFPVNGNGQSADASLGFAVLRWIGASGSQAPAYWSYPRDVWLRKFYLSSDYLKIAVSTFVQKAYAVPLTIAPRDRSVKSHTQLAEQMHTDIMYNSGLLKGFQVEFAKFSTDYATQDNGAFMLVMGPGKADGPIRGQVVGLMHLDAQRCIRTGNLEFPVMYEHADGKRYKLHYTRIIYMSSMPSADADMFDVGLCGVSRCIDATQDLLDVTTYTSEKLGSRPARQILYVKTGTTIQQLRDAVELANTRMDAQGLERFSRTMLLAPQAAGGQLELDTIDLASAPDGFDREKATVLDVAVIAAAFGLDARDLAHSFGVTGQTKADAEVQHVKTYGKGVAQFLGDFAWQLNQKALPESLESYFDYIDDSQDEQAAVIRKTRSEGRNLDLTAGTITVRVAREQMLEGEEITEEQFEDMELAEGRLSDGLDVLMLFQSQDPEIRRILDFGADPLAIKPPEPAMPTAPGVAPEPAPADVGLLSTIDERRCMAWERHDNAPNANIKRKMRQALAALDKLQGLNQQPAANESQTPPEDKEEQPVDDEEVAKAVRQAHRTALHTKQDAVLDELMDDYSEDFNRLVDSAASGETSQDDFEDEMEALVAALLLAAFLRGSRLSEAELTAAIRVEVNAEIEINLDAVSSFADDIYAGRYAPEDLGEDGLSSRVGLWIGALAGMYARGQLRRTGDPFYRWQVGATEHCTDCQRLSGQVHSASAWLSSGWIPRGGNLSCHGFRCQCLLVDATGPSNGGF